MYLTAQCASSMRVNPRVSLLLLCVVLVGVSAGGWTRVGQPVLGDGPADATGSSVALSMDGLRMAVGSPGHDGEGVKSGRVRVFDYDPVGGWIQVGNSIEAEASGDSNGFSVALNGDGSRIIIGAPNNAATGLNAGHARVFDLISDEWTQVGTDIDGVAAGDSFGYSVSISFLGNRIAVGAPYSDPNGLSSGNVRAFILQSNDWVQLGGNINGLVAQAIAGSSIALSSAGTILAVGEPGLNGATAGTVRVFDYSNGAWAQAGRTMSGLSLGDFFGSGLALTSNGVRVVIGAPYHNGGNGIYSGQVRVMDYVLGNWTQIGEDIYGIDPNDECGFSVSVSADGSKVSVGSPKYSNNGNVAGSVRVYIFKAAVNEWRQNNGGIYGDVTGDRFGESVVMSSDGARIAIGANGNDVGGNGAGQVQVFVEKEDSGSGSSAFSIKYGSVLIVIFVFGPLIFIVFLFILYMVFANRPGREKIHLANGQMKDNELSPL